VERAKFLAWLNPDLSVDQPVTQSFCRLSYFSSIEVAAEDELIHSYNNQEFNKEL
jgi:hypothetical protein